MANSQNVGIGVTGPLEKLHVDSVIKIGKNTAISSSTPGRKNALRFGDGEYVSISEETADDQLHVRMGTLLINKSEGSAGQGFVGIGVTVPTADLDLDGTLRLRSAGIAGVGKVLTSDANGNATWQAAAASGLVLPYNVTYSGTILNAVFTLANSGASGRVMYLSNENTANNSATLQVVNTANSGLGRAIQALVFSTNGTSYENTGVYAEVSGTGIFGIGVKGIGENSTGLMGETKTGTGVFGYATTGKGVSGQANGVDGVGGRFVGRTGAVPLELFNQAGGDIAHFRASNALLNKARIDGTGKGFFNGGTQTGGADVAEAFAVEGERNTYEPGDVLVISTNANRTVTKSTEPYSSLVVGVYATKPGVLLTERMEHESQDDLVPMGVIGVLPTKVCNEGGIIHRGDLLVTSSTPGHAMKGEKGKIDFGTVIGKALEDFNLGQTGIIKVLVNVK